VGEYFRFGFEKEWRSLPLGDIFKFIVHRNNSFGVFTIASSIASLERLKS
jgi:hypothetical protein